MSLLGVVEARASSNDTSNHAEANTYTASDVQMFLDFEAGNHICQLLILQSRTLRLSMDTAFNILTHINVVMVEAVRVSRLVHRPRDIFASLQTIANRETLRNATNSAPNHSNICPWLSLILTFVLCDCRAGLS